jgi:hypothetical protein
MNIDSKRLRLEAHEVFAQHRPSAVCGSLLAEDFSIALDMIPSFGWTFGFQFRPWQNRATAIPYSKLSFLPNSHSFSTRCLAVWRANMLQGLWPSNGRPNREKPPAGHASPMVALPKPIRR